MINSILNNTRNFVCEDMVENNQSYFDSMINMDDIINSEDYNLKTSRTSYGFHVISLRTSKGLSYNYFNPKTNQILLPYLNIIKCSEFAEGLAIIQDDEFNISVIDINGKILYSRKETDYVFSIDSFKYGHSVIEFNDHDIVVDHKLNDIFANELIASAFIVSRNLFVTRGKGYSKLRTKHTILGKYDRMSYSNSGKYLNYMRNGKYGYLTLNGKSLIREYNLMSSHRIFDYKDTCDVATYRTDYGESLDHLLFNGRVTMSASNIILLKNDKIICENKGSSELYIWNIHRTKNNSLTFTIDETIEYKSFNYWVSDFLIIELTSGKYKLYTRNGLSFIVDSYDTSERNMVVTINNKKYILIGDDDDIFEEDYELEKLEIFKKFENVGSRNDILYVMINDNTDLLELKTGCFRGTIDDFEKAVIKTHGIDAQEEFNKMDDEEKEEYSDDNDSIPSNEAYEQYMSIIKELKETYNI